MRRLVVVGGGISGLAAAWEAASGAARVPGGLEVLVLERESVPGGKARTIREEGWLVEAGPTAMMGGEAALDTLIREAGLEGACLPADRAAEHRFVVRGGVMREIHAHPLRFARSGILGVGGMLRILAEPLIPPRRDGADESVWSFAARRIGRQAADRLIAPMVLGVFAGDAKALSLDAAFPRLAALEREHGSLVRGMIARRREKRAAAGSAGPAAPAQAAGAPGPTGSGAPLTSFREGMQSLPLALAAAGRFEVRLGAAVERCEAVRNRGQIPRGESAGPPRLDGGAREGPPSPRWRVAVAGDPEPIPADAVILAGEPWAMAPLVRGESPALARLLDEIPCPPVAVVALGLGPEARDQVPRGFGVLIPRGEGARILGCLWDSRLFPGRGPAAHVLVRAMLGGAVDPAAGALDEESLVAITREDLRRMMGLDAAPVFRRVVRWPRAIPQYTLGHGERVRSIEAEAARLPGLFVAGNALHGIAFGKAAAAGRERGESALGFLASGTPQDPP